jgi:hypothetical protein
VQPQAGQPQQVEPDRLLVCDFDTAEEALALLRKLDTGDGRQLLHGADKGREHAKIRPRAQQEQQRRTSRVVGRRFDVGGWGRRGRMRRSEQRGRGGRLG